MPQARNPVWPSWYEPEQETPVLPNRAPSDAPLPDWLKRFDAARGATPSAPAPDAAVPEWLAKMDAERGAPATLGASTSGKETAAQSQPARGADALPDWYTPEPPAEHSPPTDSGSVLANVGTALARIPGAIAGAPRAVLYDFPNWLSGQGDKPPTDPLARAENAVLPSAEGVDRAVFKGVSALAGRDVQPYQPRSVGGQLGQAAVTGFGAGMVDPAAWAGAISKAASVAEGVRHFLAALATRAPTAVKTGIAASAAEGAHELAPESGAVPVAAALIAHTGASGVGAATRAVAPVVADAGRQVFAPTAAGTREAARTLAKVDNGLPALTQPTDGALAHATGGVQAATNAIGAGLPAYQAGTELRSALASREAELKQAREDLTAPTREARDSSGAPVNIKPVLGVIADKLTTAAGDQAAAINGAWQDLRLPTGQMRMQADQLAASRQAINARITSAKRAGDNATVKHLLDIRDALDTQVNAAVPEAGRYNELFAAASRPLAPLDASKGTVSAVPDALARDQFGGFNGTAPSEIPDSFLRGSATKEKLDQLISAFGGDKDAALGSLEQHLAGKAQSAINPDGTLDRAAFDKIMAPYAKSLNGNLSFWFPTLARKFGSANAAQETLETMNAQRGLANAVSGGALRDSSGAVTGQSFARWLRENEAALARTQSPGAVMRLKSIAGALQAPAGELADALKSEFAPAALGVALGGTEGGLMGAMLHKATKTAFSGVDAKRAEAFSRSIERATLDPKFAADLSAQFAKRRGAGLSPTRALVQAIASVPIATNAKNGRAD